VKNGWKEESGMMVYDLYKEFMETYELPEQLRKQLEAWYLSTKL